MTVQPKIMGEFLIGRKMITPQQLSAALNEQKETGEKLGRILVKLGILTEQQITETLELVLGIPHVQISKFKIDPEAVKLIAPQLIRLHKILPLSQEKNQITLAMADPLDHQALDDVRMATGMDVVPVLVGDKEMDTAIRQYLAFQLDPNIDRILNELKQEGKAPTTLQRDYKTVRINDDAPIIRLVNSIMIQAVQGHSSDIHIEPQEGAARVRFRIDGELFQVLTLPSLSVAAIVSRIKIMGGMDIAEKRIPQDGRFRLNIENREVDFRVSTMPVVHGEKVVLRILDRINTLTRVEQLGLSSSNQEYILALCQRPHGMVLVTGPTGSGKTTTLYSILNEVNSAEKNIITLEDPVEYTLPGINQVQTNSKAGLSFANGLRYILRQDPDIIMVGEIRDQETAALAVQAALTGHLVLSTLHTNSASSTIARLTDMGIEKFLLSNSLVGVISQRLVRQLCTSCRRKFILNEDTAIRLGIPEESGQEFFRPQGCNMCRQLGYQGRIALHEIIVMGSRIREMVNRSESSENILEQAAIEEGMITIKQDGINKAKHGMTSLEEVMKAVLLGG
ncbi:MAG: GspE/PulE family protein [Syntrophomonas sp.]